MGNKPIKKPAKQKSCNPVFIPVPEKGVLKKPAFKIKYPDEKHYNFAEGKPKHGFPWLNPDYAPRCIIPRKIQREDDD